MRLQFLRMCACVVFFNFAALALGADAVVTVFHWESNGAFEWVKIGKIYTFGGSLRGMRVGTLLYYLENGSGIPLLLTGSIANLSRVISLENVKIDESFIRKELPEILLGTYPEPGVLILNPSYYQLYERWYIGEKGRRDALIDRLGGYCKTPTVHVDSRGWDVSFNVINPKGEIDIWKTSGRVSPFQILEHSVRRIPIDGVFDVMPMVGGNNK